MNQILTRIKKAYHLETDAEVAKLLDIKPSTLSMQKNRGKLDLVRIINKCSDLNKNWLLDGEGPTWRDHVQNVADIPIFSSITISENGKPLLNKSNKVSQLSADEKSPEYLKGSSSDSLMGYIVSADAMEPTIKKKDIAIVDTSDKKPKDGAIFLITLNRTVGCRRVQENSGSIYSINGDNMAYQPVEVSKNGDGFCLIGKVVWIVRPM